MRKGLIIGNWKMNTTFSEAVVLTNQIKLKLEDLEGIEVALCPPYLWLYPIADLLEHAPSFIKLGAQNLYFEDEGAFTGEISGKMLKGLVKYVIVGHSERREHFKEDDKVINNKVRAALEWGLWPILAVGELKKMHEAPKGRGRPTSTEVRGNVLRQLEEGLERVSKEDVGKITIAYEPVWAIGTGEPATGAYANQVCQNIRQSLKRKYGYSASENIRILYGGSVKPDNIAEFALQPDIDGELAGGASLKAREFIAICQAVAEKHLF